MKFLFLTNDQRTLIEAHILSSIDVLSEENYDDSDKAFCKEVLIKQLYKIAKKLGVRL